MISICLLSCFGSCAFCSSFPSYSPSHCLSLLFYKGASYSHCRQRRTPRGMSRTTVSASRDSDWRSLTVRRCVVAIVYCVCVVLCVTMLNLVCLFSDWLSRARDWGVRQQKDEPDPYALCSCCWSLMSLLSLYRSCTTTLANIIFTTLFLHMYWK